MIVATVGTNKGVFFFLSKFANGLWITSDIVALLDTRSWHFAARRSEPRFLTLAPRAFSSFRKSHHGPWDHVGDGSSCRYEAVALLGSSFRDPVLRLCPPPRPRAFSSFRKSRRRTRDHVGDSSSPRYDAAAIRGSSFRAPVLRLCPQGRFRHFANFPRDPSSGWRLMCPTVRVRGTSRRAVWIPGLGVTQLPWVDVHCYHFGFFINWYYEGEECLSGQRLQ